MHSPILAPVVALVVWSLVMLLWLLAVRLPALKKAGIDIGKARGGRPGLLDTVLDEKDQWPAHNYIHLMEQPTLFYAIAITLAVLGQGGGYSLWLAWAYVGLRVLHSIVQATFNKISIRFLLFVLSTGALIGLAAQGVRALMVAGLLW
ncbi:MAPEG family protein [Sphingomonas canadensis]|uniref:MAPEG family protein n=1 Tax=Sphingomonas canadensis TaxID=1219257 RepID=A0ABW3H473_9SPHN|nr:MAPEG family protein [Sphingomonas canadensis]MCW3835571.1 MAPEG family protein [Sphingomonas canadensis]